MAAASGPASTRSNSREKVVERGAGEILLTSMDRDGTKAGYDIALTRAVADAVRAPVIASGGVGTLDHLVEGIRDGHATAVLAASIFHFGTYSIAEAKAHMASAGLAVRLDSASRLNLNGRDMSRFHACRPRTDRRRARPLRRSRFVDGEAFCRAASTRRPRSSAKRRSRR